MSCCLGPGRSREQGLDWEFELMRRLILDGVSDGWAGLDWMKGLWKDGAKDDWI